MHRNSRMAALLAFLVMIFLFFWQNTSHSQVPSSKEDGAVVSDLIDKVVVINLAQTQQRNPSRKYSVRVLEVDSSSEEAIDSILLLRVDNDNNASYSPQRFDASEISRLAWKDCVYIYNDFKKTLVCNNKKHSDAIETRLKAKQEQAREKLREEERLAKEKQEEDERMRLAKEEQELAESVRRAKEKREEFERALKELNKKGHETVEGDKKDETKDLAKNVRDSIVENAPEIIFEVGKFIISNMFNTQSSSQMSKKDSVSVKGYTKKNGTQVAPYSRSAPGKAPSK
jgi:hypothetical protein